MAVTDQRIQDALPTAAALVCAVTDGDQEGVAAALAGADLVAVSIVLAANVDIDSPLRTHPRVSVVNQAIVRAAAEFATTRTEVLSDARARGVCDARMVAMSACRLAGMSSPDIGAAFGRDHSTVLHAAARCGETPRLQRLVLEIAASLPGYAGPTINEEGAA